MSRLIIKFNNGDVYEVNKRGIAQQRANYYAWEVKGFPPTSKEYLDEVEYGKNHPEELIDWMQNNMDWYEVSTHATLVSSEFDYESEFMKAEIKLEK